MYFNAALRWEPSFLKHVQAMVVEEGRTSNDTVIEIRSWARRPRSVADGGVLGSEHGPSGCAP